ncbi:hypothetical protein JCM10207_008576 [Rhodosporidiobolus poonsookiae]
MEDVNVRPRDGGSARETALAQGEAARNDGHLSPSSSSPSSPPPETTSGPTLYDLAVGYAEEAYGALRGNKQDEEAGRMLRTYGSEGLEAAQKSGGGSALG